jgi:hypothetical protein
MGLGGRSSTFCEVGRRKVFGQSDNEGRRGEAARPMTGKKTKKKTNRGSRNPWLEKKNKKTNRGSLARSGEARPLRDLPLPSSFFLFSFFSLLLSFFLACFFLCFFSSGHSECRIILCNYLFRLMWQCGIGGRKYDPLRTGRTEDIPKLLLEMLKKIATDM